MSRARMETIKEDATECWLFALPSAVTGDSVPEDLLAQIRAILTELTRQYLWHKDSFDVFLPIVQNKELPPHLYSLTYYGDNIEDEWFIVYLLMELSKKLPGLTAQVRDNDGEFLLIESADTLPGWATPDSTQNRVFIMNGAVHLVPPDILDLNKTISVTEALNCLVTNSEVTKASSNVQAAVQKRIQCYPQHISDCLHRATVSIPAKYAAVLKIEPTLIAQVVNAYCSRDSMEANICNKIILESCVDTTVTFTKCLYAMLTHATMINKPTLKLPLKSSEYYKKSMLGAKLACGFEILISKASQDTFSSKEWKIYLESLKNNGYFKENIEGSNNYTKLLDAAKKYFLANECSNINSHVANNIQRVFSTTEFKDVVNNIIQSGVTGEEDSDEWLNINPEELNNLMSERYGKKSSLSKDEMITPQTLTNQLSSFLTQTSDLEGIEVENNEDYNQTSNSSEDRIEFDYDQFTEKVKNILDLIVPEENWNLDSGTDLSEYGSDDDFMTGMEENGEYQQTLEKELSSSTLSQSFVTEGQVVDISKNTFVNMLQSIKEERGSSGPSSNILANIGISKTCVPLDSDDDDDT